MKKIIEQGKYVKEFWKVHPYLIAGTVLAVAGAGWYATHRPTSTDVTLSTLGTVTRGTVIKSVSGTGKMQAAEEFDMKPKVGGDVVEVNIRPGELVKKGDVLVRIDANDASKVLRDAQVSYQSARVSLRKQEIQNATTLSSVTPEQTLSNMVTRMTKFYADFAQIDKDLDSTLHDHTADPSRVTDMRNVDYYASYDPAYKSYPGETDALYAEMKQKYANGLRALDLAKTGSSADRKAALTSAQDLTRSAQALTKMTMDLLRSFEYRLAQDNATHNAQPLVAAERTTNQADINTLDSAYQDFLAADAKLLDYKQSTDVAPYDAESASLSVRAKANTVSDAADKLGDYVIRAPIDGVAASVPVKVGDNINTGTLAVTVISSDMEANLSLSEVDAAQVQVGQKATLTFDAFPDLTLTGKVVEKDILGAVTSNVVSYTVKIAPDTTDSRLLPNMSVSADVITSAKVGVLMVPSGAIKTNGESVIQEPAHGDLALTASSTTKGIALTLPTVARVVTLGLVGNSYTEITSGLSEGERIVVRTNKVGAATTQSKSIFQAAGGGGGGSTRGLGGGR